MLGSSRICLLANVLLARGYCQRLLGTKSTAHQEALMARGLPKKAPLTNVKHIVVVASGKGGVGKSTVAVNLAVGLAQLGYKIGLLDGDIFGPSIPIMMNISEEPLINEANLMIPLINYDIKCLSIGLITQQNKPVIWRGPLVMSALQRLLKGAVWGPLDVLIVDTPPGTGDVHLSLNQNVPLSGVVLVSTAQKAAINVTIRGARMYETFGIPIIGFVENMSYVICGNCQNQQEIFRNSSEVLAESLQTKILVSIPLESEISNCCDTGVPIILKFPNSKSAKGFKSLAEQLAHKLQLSKTDSIGI